jgi:hypothetical protein
MQECIHTQQHARMSAMTLHLGVRLSEFDAASATDVKIYCELEQFPGIGQMNADCRAGK